MTAFKFWQSVANTPWWMYLFFLYLILLSYRTTKPQRIALIALQLGPGFYLLVSLASMIWLINTTPKNVAYWAAALTGGVLVGWLQFRIKNVKAIEDTKILQVPGTFLFLAFICTAIFAKFYYGYTPDLIAMYVNLSLSTMIKSQSDRVMLLLGLLTGLLSGRFLYARKVIQHGPYVPAS